MKKALVLVLTLAMSLSLAACSGKDNHKDSQNDTQNQNQQESQTESIDINGPAAEGEGPGEMPGLDADANVEGSIGSNIASDFKEKAADLSAEKVVEELLVNTAVVDLGLMMIPVQEGLLTGFDNYEVKGFKEGYAFAPMIGTIPFVGYVFEVEEDMDAFVENLKTNANTRWNVCTEADETVVEVVGSKVLFLMCPSTLEEE